MARLGSSLALAALLTLAACGSEGAAPDNPTATPAVDAAVPDATGRADPSVADTDAPTTGRELIAEAPGGAASRSSGAANPYSRTGAAPFVPAAPAKRAPERPAALSDAPAPARGLTVANDTGMRLVTLHIAGCGESEGNDWSEMETWATDYLGDETLEAGDSVALNLAPGCYVMRPEWEDGTAAQERVEATAGMTHSLTLG